MVKKILKTKTRAGAIRACQGVEGEYVVTKVKTLKRGAGPKTYSKRGYGKYEVTYRKRRGRR